MNRAWEWFGGMVALSATNLGVELGLFEALQRYAALSPAELAATLGLQPRAVDAWAKTLVHNGLLEADGDGRVGMAPGLELMVCDPRTLLNLEPSLAYHARYLARDFLDLADFFRDGTPIPPARHGEALARNIAAQTEAMHAVFLAAVLPELRDVVTLLERGARVFDAGCGAANLGVQLCGLYPGVAYTGIDLDVHALRQGVEAAGAAGFGERVGLIHGDIATEPIPELFDLAFLFLSLHEIPVADRGAALATIHGALRAGGLLVIFDESYPETLAAAAAPAARMGLHFEYTEMLWGSNVPTAAEVDALLAGAGFAPPARVSVLEGSIEVVVAANP